MWPQDAAAEASDRENAPSNVPGVSAHNDNGSRGTKARTRRPTKVDALHHVTGLQKRFSKRKSLAGATLA